MKQFLFIILTVFSTLISISATDGYSNFGKVLLRKILFTTNAVRTINNYNNNNNNNNYTNYTNYTNYNSRDSKRTFSKSMRKQKYAEQNGICAHCGKKCSFFEIEGDHVVPWSKGGRTDYANLQMLCRKCNRSKCNRYSY